MEKTLFIKPCRSSYLALVLPYIVLGIVFFISFCIVRPDGIYDMWPCYVGFLFIGLCFFIWLKGFYISVSDHEFIYRDGVYKKHILKTSEIKEVASGSEYFKRIGPRISVPRLIVVPKDKTKEEIVINIKVLSLKDIRILREALDKIVEKNKGLR